jgi:hypothetical protein
MFRKAAIGVGFAGALVCGASLMSRRRHHTPLDALTKEQNEALQSVPDLCSGATRLQEYAHLDRPLVDMILTQCAHLVEFTKQPPTLRNVRNVDNTILRIKARLRQLRARVLEHSSAVVPEFEEVSDALKEACESQSFNIHQRLSSF